MDPLEAKRRENKHGRNLQKIQKRYTHKKTFTVTDVNIKFFLPKCTQVVSYNFSFCRFEFKPETDF